MLKRLRFFALFPLFFLINPLAAEENLAEVDDQLDYESLQEWLEKQRKIGIKERGGKLTVAGEVRTELQAFNEVKSGDRRRGSNAALYPAPSRGYDVEVNLMLDYRTERTWASVKLEFDNNAGIGGSAGGSGTFNNITTERAFFGMRVLNEDTYTFDIVIGRRPLNYTFDSRIQFSLLHGWYSLQI